MEKKRIDLCIKVANELKDVDMEEMDLIFQMIPNEKKSAFEFFCYHQYMTNNIIENKWKENNLNHEIVTNMLNKIIERYYEADKEKGNLFENIVDYVNDINMGK